MIEVEGEEYRRFKTKEEFENCSFDAFFEEWEKNYSKHPERRNYKPEFSIDVHGMHSIYGWGGWNRYLVFNNGEIAFIRGLARFEFCVDDAKRAGFRIW
ncbi:MAG: hypothetical protein M1416_02390 [Candidatus Pacearchaeota archaeon]|nr:hypothetical protein [Candidatus Pacearchaeota archaeon]